jgi:hypothetical protein
MFVARVVAGEQMGGCAPSRLEIREPPGCVAK